MVLTNEIAVFFIDLDSLRNNCPRVFREVYIIIYTIMGIYDGLHYLHVLAIAEFLEVGETGELDHGRRSTHQYLGGGSWAREMGGYHFSIHKS